MNILPMVLFCILALAAFVSAFYQKGADLTIEHRTVISLAETARNGERRIQDASYERIKKSAEKKKVKEPPKSTSTAPKKKPPPSPRIGARLSSAAKLNIFPLFTDQGEKKLETTLLNLFSELYPAILSQGEGKALLSALIQSGKKHLQEQRIEDSESTAIWFEDLYPANHKQRSAYYRILRGTKHYNLETGEGYPPLFHFVDFINSDKIANFPSIPTEILSALFGREQAQKILEEEESLRNNDEKKQLTLSKGELESLLADKSLISLLNFKSFSAKDKPFSMKDPKTLITFELRRD
jgi:hypothetical protein